MGEKSSNRLANNLEQLVSKVEGAYSQRSSELDQVSGVLGNMDKLVDIIYRAELQRQSEQQLNEKLEKLNEVIERLSSQETVINREVPVEDTVRKVIKGVKVTGKIIDIVAGSMGVMFDSIVTTVKAGETRNAARSNKEEVNLASVLAPLGGIIQGLFGTEQVDSDQSKQSKQSKQSVQEEKKEE